MKKLKRPLTLMEKIHKIKVDKAKRKAGSRGRKPPVDRSGRRPSKYASYLLAVMKWLDKHLCLSGFPHAGVLVMQKYLSILSTRGKTEAIAYNKAARQAIFQWLCACDIPAGLIASPKKYGVPKTIRTLLKDVKSPSSYPLIRLILSGLYASRELTLPPLPNVESITGPPKKGLEPVTEESVRKFWSCLGYNRYQFGRIPKDVYFKRFHLSTKVGPNGQAMWSALTDLLALPDSLIESIRVVGGPKLARKIDILRGLGPASFLHRFFRCKEGGRFRKISAIPSQEGKTREVAILDYWSQTALRGFHQYLFGVLRRIPQDCTFNQGSFLDKLPKPAPGVCFYSIDLTAATDRFPIEVISKVLEGRFDRSFVNHWRNIMVGYPFWTHSHGFISYAVGNPMGAYSSWNSFAIAHHYVVFSCCEDLGINWRDAPYVILGDDVVIANERLALAYMEKISAMGVEFSRAKTHISNIMYEFAKRIVYNGTELTPFPVAALWTTRKAMSLSLNVLVSESGKGWLFPDGIPRTLSELYSYVGLPRRRVRRMEWVMFVGYQCLLALQGKSSAYEALKPCMERFYPLLELELTPSIAQEMFRQVVLQGLTNSFTSLFKPEPGKELGLLAEKLVMLITGELFSDEAFSGKIQGVTNVLIEDPSLLVQAVPILGVQGQIEEKYLQVRKAVDSLDALIYGDWKLIIRALELPSSDAIYISRNQDIRAVASFTFAKKLLTLMERMNRFGLGLTPFTPNRVTGSAPLFIG